MQRLRIIFSKYKIALFCGIIFLNSCQIFSPKFNPNSNEYYETFFTGNNQSQYFIKPIVFENENDDRLEMDLVVKDKTKLSDSTNFNVSLITTFKSKEIDSIRINFEKTSYTFSNVQNMFTERSEEKFKSRYNFKLVNSITYKLFEESNWNLSIYTTNKIVDFKLNNSNLEKFKTIDEKLIQVIK